MRRSLEFQKQSYAVHKEAWHSRNEYHNQGWSMQMLPSPCTDYSELSNHRVIYSGNHAQQHDGWGEKNKYRNGWHGTSGYYDNHATAGQRLPINGIDTSLFSHGGMFNNAMVNAEYNTIHKVHVPATVRVKEIRYEHRSWGNNGCHNYDENFDWQHSDCEDVEWMSKRF